MEGPAALTRVSPSSTSAAGEQAELLKGWRVSDGALSLPEVNGSVRVPGPDSAWYAKAAAFAGLGGMIAVGYMDPGNWCCTAYTCMQA